MNLETPSRDWEPPLHVLVIEDDLDIFEVVELCLKTRWPDSDVLHAPSGEFGVEMARTEQPDVVVLDIGLPDIDGFEVCSRIRAFSNTSIVMLTVRDSKEDIVRGLELGADDYIVKPFTPKEFTARVHAVLRRTQIDHLRDLQIVVDPGGLIISIRQGEIQVNGKPIRLAPTEYQIFYHLISNAGRVIARQALMDRIWGEEHHDEPYFLSSRIAMLKDKLRDYPQTQSLILQEETEGYSLTTVGVG